MVPATLILRRDSSIHCQHWARTIPSPAQPIWESNIDTHFLTSAGGAVAVAGLSNESLLRLCCDLWLVPAAGCGDAPSSDSTSRWRGERSRAQGHHWGDTRQINRPLGRLHVPPRLEECSSSPHFPPVTICMLAAADPCTGVEPDSGHHDKYWTQRHVPTWPLGCCWSFVTCFLCKIAESKGATWNLNGLQ